jgi:hypothetical protein
MPVVRQLLRQLNQGGVFTVADLAATPHGQRETMDA